MPPTLHHRVVPMTGRDPGEAHRAATPLELLYDLTFVAAYGLAANELAHFFAEDHVSAGLISFAFVLFAITWAWVSFSWFASAFDTDDWIFRLATMVQMVGVIVLALGVPDLFDSVYEGETVDNAVLVAGYVVMRVALVFLWARAARENPERRAACVSYITAILIAQAGWVALLIADTSVEGMIALAVPLIVLEIAGPWIAERRMGGTPWHPHHIAERYGLLVIIALGEGILGTIVSLSAVVGPEGPGWSLDAALVAISGTALTFGLWWIYFILPSAQVLDARRERAVAWGLAQIPIIGSVVAMGAGLHAAAYYLEDESALGASATVTTVVIPVAIFITGAFLIYSLLTRSYDGFHVALVAVTAGVLAAPPLMAAAGASMAACLLVLSLSPWVTVVGYELRGHEHNAQVISRLAEEAPPRPA